ncbi:MAG TPA: histidine kinase [Vicinamibacterales bacterium]
MHPILGDSRRRRVFAVTWPVVGAALGVLPLWWAGGRLRDWWAVALWGEALALPMLASFYVCKSAPIGTSGAARVFATVGVAALVTAGLWLEAGRLWLWLVSVAAPSPDAAFDRMTVPAAAGAALVFVAMSAIHYALAAADERQLAVERALEAEIAAREAELRALRAQVDPHFLFNCLHSISALITSDPAAARSMCVELADFFRESLRVGAKPRISLATEAALIRRYLDIEQLRFGDRLNASVEVASDAEQGLVPPLLLQPLAENAVRHGIATLVQGGDVTIAITRRGDRIEVNVENAYDADGQRSGTGVGLANVRARLDASYHGRASLKVQSSESRFRAVISLPVEESV